MLISSYKQLSRRYLKGNKKRTVLTVLGIMLSVALISTIGLFMNGTQLAKIEQAKKEYGASFHVGISNYDEAILNKIRYNPQIESFGFISQGDTFPIGEVSMQTNFADNQALEFLTYSLSDGNLPTNDREAAVDSWILPYLKEDLRIGDLFELDGKTYQLVGLLNNKVDAQENKTAQLLTYKSEFTLGEGSILAEINEKANFAEVLEGIKLLADKGNSFTNDSLNDLLKLESYKEIKALLVIVISIVVISTVVVIYNAFQISVVERMKQFGLLRSIGATRKQIRQIVLREAFGLAAIAIPLGIICSIIALAILQFTLSIVLEDSTGISVFYIDWKILLISSIITLLAVLASSYYPAFFAGRISPLLAISSRLDIKKETIKKQKNTVLKKPFSFPLSVALKNIKRNKNRYTVTILSIIISSVLFITFTSLMDMAIKDTKKPDLEIHLQDDEQNFSVESKQVLEQLKSLKNISNVDQIDFRFRIELKDVDQSSVTVEEIQQTIGQTHSITVNNYVDANKENNEGILLIQVLAWGFITVISLIGSLNIFNTITISIMVRRKELAALKSIGMSQRDLKKMIIYEALVYGFFGSLQGIIYGCMLSYIIYVAIKNKLDFPWTIPYGACLITFVAALLISYLSVLIPLRKIQKDTIIESIREQ